MLGIPTFFLRNLYMTCRRVSGTDSGTILQTIIQRIDYLVLVLT